jgi:hypothetical protein
MTDEKQENMWIYGIVPAGASLQEVEQRRERINADVWVVELADLAAIVSDAPPEDDAKALRDQALSHARVLEAAIVDAPVVPFRFGNVVPGGDEAVGNQLLEARHDEFARQLEKFKNYVQMTLKVNYDEDAVLRRIIDSQPEIAQLRDQARQGDEATTHGARVRLGEMISNALQHLRERDASDILGELKPVSVASVADDLENEFMVLNVPFLVDRGRLSEFEAAVEKVAEGRGTGLRVTLLGPLPAYSFLDAEQPAWA